MLRQDLPTPQLPAHRPVPRPLACQCVWVLPAVCLMLLGCPTPTQYGGPIPINPAGIEERIAWVCGLGQSNPDVSAFCFTDDAQPAPPPQLPASAAPAAASAPIPSVAADLQAQAPGDPAAGAPVDQSVESSAPTGQQ